jgi:hypothetical protein
VPFKSDPEVDAMRIVRRDGKYWIVNVPDTVTDCGEYDTKKEAESDLQGLKRFFKRDIKQRPAKG